LKLAQTFLSVLKKMAITIFVLLFTFAKFIVTSPLDFDALQPFSIYSQLCKAPLSIKIVTLPKGHYSTDGFGVFVTEGRCLPCGTGKTSIWYYVSGVDEDISEGGYFHPGGTVGLILKLVIILEGIYLMLSISTHF
jgi:hypothetical protein